MFKKALVGVDQSPAEASLLSCVPDLRHWGIESVVLAHVIRIGYAQGAGYGHEEEYRAWLEADAAPIREAGLTVNTSVTASGDSAAELLTVAHSQGADLVVVGSRSHNFLHQIFLGSVAREVIRSAELPVLLERLEPSRAGHAETCVAVCSRPLERILLATDLTTQSRPAEESAVRLAAKSGHVACLTVLPSDVGEADRKAVEAHHQALVRRINDAGGRAGSRIEHGDPSEVIARTAQEGYTLIIVGKHGQNRVAGKIIGSTAARVCEVARRPVLMVPLQEA